MNTSAQLYTLNYSELRTYYISALFVLANIILPQLCHLIPQGGIILAPLSLVILVGAYKFGWKVGLLAAVASPVVNHLLFGAPAPGVLQVMAMKLIVLALVAGMVAKHFGKVTILLLCAVVLLSELLGGLGELALTGGIAATVADFTIGLPGMLLQIILGYFLISTKLGI